jgi:signal transduction histidine kinase
MRTVQGTLWTRTKVLITDGYTWRSLAWLLLRFPAGIFSFVVGVTLPAVAVGMTVAPVVAVATGFDWEATFTEVTFPGSPVFVEPALTLIAIPLGLLLLVVTPHVINGIAWLHVAAATPLLGVTAKERATVLETRTGVLEERAKLARELHDAVGHTVTVMVVQAGAGRHVFDSDPEFAKESLETIETSGRKALSELDRILGLMRGANGDGPERVPQAGLADLPRLIAEVRDAGLNVGLDIKGDLDGLPQDLDRSAYRIVQEALTNVLKHAGPARVTVTLQRRPDALEIEVVDDGRMVTVPGGSSRTGHGLVGIAERASLFGGHSEAGPRPGGGFRVWVVLPVIDV